MSLLDSTGMRRWLASSVRYRRPEALPPSEHVDASWYASRNTRFGVPLVFGQLILSYEHLVFSPADLEPTLKLLKALADQEGSVAKYLVEEADRNVRESTATEPLALALSDIRSVEPVGKASLLRGPMVRFGLGSGRVLEFAILAAPLTLNLNRENEVARDECVARIRVALGSLGAAHRTGARNGQAL